MSAKSIAPIFNVLAVSVTAALAAGKYADELAVGQAGVFDADTNLSIDTTTTTVPQRIYIAVKGKDGRLVKSAGPDIQTAGIQAYNGVCPKAATTATFTLTPGAVKCGVPFGFRVAFDNSKIREYYGYNIPTKVFIVDSGCCSNDSCGGCSAGDPNEAIIKLHANVVANAEGMFTAALMDGATVVTNTATWLADADNAGKVLSLKVDVQNITTPDFANVPIKYFQNRAMALTPSVVVTESCANSLQVTSFTGATQALGEGIDLKVDEYIAGGWEGNPGVYRTSSVEGLPIHEFRNDIEVGANYIVVNLQYANETRSGFLDYQPNFLTTIAIKHTATAAYGIVYILDTMLGKKGFKPLSPALACVTTQV